MSSDPTSGLSSLESSEFSAVDSTLVDQGFGTAPSHFLRAHQTEEPVQPLSDEDDVLRQGSVSIQEGSPEYSIWRSQWLVLTETALLLRAARCSPLAPIIISLRDVESVARSDRHPHCLLLKTQDNNQRYLSFTTDEDLFGWLDDIASRANCRVHHTTQHFLRAL
ncbi:hypothetical protein C8F04DRAFT_1276237 [Mycena alexandri]|uniref:PH domain-containing protein n=1 Tax=Mycena alexandri TaxID=1745969 RepID=A0AAD6WL10_9AGAR|nr:hypothetical protein C8F04DRAFT_1278538 [Mycena alexandri]KAJ7019421.1 hypothetical protein C8F04DRAFT_1276237 [Mycena alexandri]